MNDQSIVSATVVFDQEPLFTINMAPTAFDCMALLQAVYFIFSIDYPQVYKPFLLAIENIITSYEGKCWLVEMLKYVHLRNTSALALAQAKSIRSQDSSLSRLFLS